MTRGDLSGFEWDKGNIDKSYQRHGISPNEAEEVFHDWRAMMLNDESHSVREKRFTIIGKTANGAVLFIAFTIRVDSIRIISARIANKKERRLYENQKA